MLPLTCWSVGVGAPGIESRNAIQDNQHEHKEGKRPAMRRYAIQSPNGRFAHFRGDEQESKAAIVKRRPFGTTWGALVAAGYKCVKVEIKVLQDCSATS